MPYKTTISYLIGTADVTIKYNCSNCNNRVVLNQQINNIQGTKGIGTTLLNYLPDKINKVQKKINRKNYRFIQQKECPHCAAKQRLHKMRPLLVFFLWYILVTIISSVFILLSYANEFTTGILIMLSAMLLIYGTIPACFLIRHYKEAKYAAFNPTNITIGKPYIKPSDVGGRQTEIYYHN